MQSEILSCSIFMFSIPTDDMREIEKKNNIYKLKELSESFPEFHVPSVACSSCVCLSPTIWIFNLMTNGFFLVY
jgi:hypothetical protein